MNVQYFVNDGILWSTFAKLETSNKHWVETKARDAI